MKKYLALLIGILIGMLFLWLAARDIDALSTWETLRKANGWYVIPFLIVLTLFYVIKAYRWALLLKDSGAPSWRGLFPTIIAGYAANTVLPMQFGELVRAYLASRSLRVPLAPTLTSLLLERGLDFISILFVVGLSALFSDDINPQLVRAGWVAAGVAGAITIGLVAYVFFTDRCIHILRLLVAPLPRVFGEKLLALASDGAQGVGSIRSFPTLLAVLLMSAAQWLLMGLCIAFGIGGAVTGSTLDGHSRRIDSDGSGCKFTDRARLRRDDTAGVRACATTVRSQRG